MIRMRTCSIHKRSFFSWCNLKFCFQDYTIQFCILIPSSFPNTGYVKFGAQNEPLGILSCALCWIFQESSDVSNMNKTFPPKYELSCLFSKNKQNNSQSKMPILKTDSFIWETKSCVQLNYTIICSIIWITQLQNSHHKNTSFRDMHSKIWYEFNLN